MSSTESSSSATDSKPTRSRATTSNKSPSTSGNKSPRNEVKNYFRDLPSNSDVENDAVASTIAEITRHIGKYRGLTKEQRKEISADVIANASKLLATLTDRQEKATARQNKIDSKKEATKEESESKAASKSGSKSGSKSESSSTSEDREESSEEEVEVTTKKSKKSKKSDNVKHKVNYETIGDLSEAIGSLTTGRVKVSIKDFLYSKKPGVDEAESSKAYKHGLYNHYKAPFVDKGKKAGLNKAVTANGHFIQELNRARAKITKYVNKYKGASFSYRKFVPISEKTIKQIDHWINLRTDVSRNYYNASGVRKPVIDTNPFSGNHLIVLTKAGKQWLDNETFAAPFWDTKSTSGSKKLMYRKIYVQEGVDAAALPKGDLPKLFQRGFSTSIAIKALVEIALNGRRILKSKAILKVVKRAENGEDVTMKDVETRWRLTDAMTQLFKDNEGLQNSMKAKGWKPKSLGFTQPEKAMFVSLLYKKKDTVIEDGNEGELSFVRTEKIIDRDTKKSIGVIPTKEQTAVLIETKTVSSFSKALKKVDKGRKSTTNSSKARSELSSVLKKAERARRTNRKENLGK